MAIDSHNHCILPEKMQRCQDYMQALEEERRKIQVFQRELPLCLQLVTQAIESCKQQLSGTTTECNFNSQSQSSEETSSDLPVFEEFIPIKRASSHSDSDEQEPKKQKIDGKNGGENNIQKSDWLRSVQLWNQNPDPTSSEDSPRKVEVKRDGNGGAFHAYKKDKPTSPSNEPPVKNLILPGTTTSAAGTGGSGGGSGNKKEEKEGVSRKARRSWSNELHRKFLQALHQLGGSHLATPKQIRELMKVDGLTNDEVKSHLQKYRLHARRPSSPMRSATTTPAATPPPQFVVVTGGLWMPPEYAATMATVGNPADAAGVVSSNIIYAPVATLPPPFERTSSVSSKQRQHKITANLDNLVSRNENGVRSDSPAGSSSTHTSSA